MGYCTVAHIVKDVCEARWSSLLDDYMSVPKKEDWKRIAEDFSTHWAFSNCLGVIDGKRVIIQAPPCSSSLFVNYKGTFLIVLLAVVDAHYPFRMVNMGVYGRNSDRGMLYASGFHRALRHGTLDLPEDTPLPGTEELGAVPHVFVAHDTSLLEKTC